MVLAQNDFLFRGNSYWTGGLDGTSEFHTNLTNPLVDEGVFCRKFENPSSATTIAVIYGSINSTTDSGLWVNNLVNYGYSLRAWVRTSTATNSGSPDPATSIGLFCGYSNFTAGTITTTEYGPRFMLGLQKGGFEESFLNLVFDGDNSANAAKADDLPTTNTAYAKNLGTQANDTWYRIRLDVIPTVDYYLLKAYIGTGITDNETWTILENRKISPGTGTATISNAHMGFYAHNATTSGSLRKKTLYIDRFSARAIPVT